MRWIVATAVIFICACAPQSGGDALETLFRTPKFEATALYTGVSDPAEKAALVRIVNDAIGDIVTMPKPLDSERVRNRLRSVIGEVDLYETEDRERACMYLVQAWRAAGFDTESGLFPVPDDRVLSDS